MRFELSQEIIDQIIFGMEDQAAELCFDSQDLQVIDVDEAAGIYDSTSGDSAYEDRFLPLPTWQSIDGFNLMEAFVLNLRNPVQRENLRQILQSGRGVFRQFKDALKEHKEIERLWFRFKQKEMRKKVLDWYNDLREFWGLEPLSWEEEVETTDLLLSDFVFMATGPELSDKIAEWDRRLFAEMFPRVDAEECDFYFKLKRCGLSAPAASADSIVIRSCGPLGEIAGFIWAQEYTLAKPGGIQLIARIIQLGVEPEYRGLGMGTALLANYQKVAAERGVQRFIIEIPAAAEYMGRSCEHNGYHQHAIVWEISLPGNS